MFKFFSQPSCNQIREDFNKVINMPKDRDTITTNDFPFLKNIVHCETAKSMDWKLEDLSQDDDELRLSERR